MLTGEYDGTLCWVEDLPENKLAAVKYVDNTPGNLDTWVKQSPAHLLAHVSAKVACVQRQERMLATVNEVHQVQLQQSIHRVLLYRNSTHSLSATFQSLTFSNHKSGQWLHHFHTIL